MSAKEPTTPLPSFRRRALFALPAAATIPAAATLFPATVHADPSVNDGETRVIDVPLPDAEVVDADGTEVREITGIPATMVGVTWSESLNDPTIQVRGRANDEEWSPWFDLEIARDPETGEETLGTEAAWLGAVNAIQLSVLDGDHDASDQVTAHVITTSPTSVDANPAAASGSGRLSTTSSSKSAAVANLGTGAPRVISRVGWGADESLTRSTSSAPELKSIIIHHTAGSNSYSASTSPQIIRGMLSYHTKTQGWSDLGYNVIVDKYGQVFEGRKGGIAKHIVGAHAMGFNTGSFGISVMGDYTSAAPPAAAQTAVANVAAWKLLSVFKDSVTASESWRVGASGTKFRKGSTVNLQRVIGHRDVNFTTCPGNAWYNALPSLRTKIQSRIGSLKRDTKGLKSHQDAFNRAGGTKALGTVNESATTHGALMVTRLTSGLIVSGGRRGVVAQPSPFAQQWKSSWGYPLAAPVTSGSRTTQRFEMGEAIREGKNTRFVATRFIDVSPSDMFYAEIHELASRGIVTGWPDNTYRPLVPVQRDAVVAFIYRAMGSPRFTPPSRSPFRDLTPRTQFYKEITWAHREGIVNGWPDRTFRPTAPIERAAIAAMLMRTAKGSSSSNRTPFRDVPPKHQFAREVSWAHRNGITTGWPDGTFRPEAPTNRDAMAAFMVRWLPLVGR